MKGISNHQEEELVRDDLLSEQKHFMDILILSSSEPHEAGFSSYLHFIHMGLGFEKKRLGLRSQKWEGPEARHKARSMTRACVFTTLGGGRGLCPLCRPLDEVYEWCSLGPLLPM